MNTSPEDNMSAASPGSTGDLGGDVNASSTLPRLRLLWLGRGSVSTSSKPRFLSSEGRGWDWNYDEGVRKNLLNKDRI